VPLAHTCRLKINRAAGLRPKSQPISVSNKILLRGCHAMNINMTNDFAVTAVTFMVTVSFITLQNRAYNIVVIIITIVLPVIAITFVGDGFCNLRQRLYNFLKSIFKMEIPHRKSYPSEKN
jgi:hypothetical protein